MLYDTNKHLNKLIEILIEKEMKHLFPCIKDLIVNGLTLTRFSSEDQKPTRQDITQYILAWIRYRGLSTEECLDWMMEYCLEVLAPLSSSSLSRIRHSTKSNIKYIYRSEVPFECECENNPFKALCEKSCPVYEEMSDKKRKREEEEAREKEEREKRDAEFRKNLEPPPMLKRDKYKEQFDKAMETVQKCINEGKKRKEIVKLLNDRDFKTRTGKKWTYEVLLTEMNRYKKNKEKENGKSNSSSP